MRDRRPSLSGWHLLVGVVLFGAALALVAAVLGHESRNALLIGLSAVAVTGLFVAILLVEAGGDR